MYGTNIYNMVNVTPIFRLQTLFDFSGNFLSILILYQRDMDLKPMFRQILITLISFDIFCIIFNLVNLTFKGVSGVVKVSWI